MLAGPDRVYNIAYENLLTSNITVWNYYRIQNGTTNTYYYCAKQILDETTMYGKINSISVSGYILLEIGTDTDSLEIKIGDNTSFVFYATGNTVKLEEWFSNGFGLKVEYKNNLLTEIEEFNPNGDEYITGRSPYGTSYILNFKYMYDNGWITKEQILDIEDTHRSIHNINLDFYDNYTKY